MSALFVSCDFGVVCAYQIDNCRNETTVGCLLDLNKHEMVFFVDGVSQGPAFTGIKVPSDGLCPAFSIARGQRIKVNFGGKTDYKYAVVFFRWLLSFLSLLAASSYDR